jgi:MFS transporter, DHA2 family, metal-tetracycline-proton antiporter
MDISRVIFIRVLVISTAVIPGVLSTAMLTLGFGDIAQTFGVTYSNFQWRNVVFFGCFSVGILLFGAVVSTVGPKRCIIFGQLLFLASAVVSFVSQNWYVFLAAQIGQALADGAIVPAQMALLRRTVQTERLGWAFGWFQGCLAASGLLGPIVGAMLLNLYGWQSIFLALAFTSAISLALASVFIPADEPRKERTKVPPILSAAALLLGMLSFQYVLDGAALKANDVAVVILAISIFGLVEYRYKLRGCPTLVPWQFATQTAFCFALIRILLVFLVSNGLSLHNPTALRQLTPLSLEQISLALMAAAATSTILQPVLGKWADRIPDKMISGGLILFLAATGGMILLPSASGATFGLLVALMVTASVGSAMFGPAQLRMVALITTGPSRDHFMSFYMFVQFSSGAVAGALLGSIIEDSVLNRITPASYGSFILISTLMLLLALLTVLLASVATSRRAAGGK